MDFVLGHGASYMEADIRDMTDKEGFMPCTFQKTQQSILFGYLIPTRQNKSQSKQFCIGDLTLFGLI